MEQNFQKQIAVVFFKNEILNMKNPHHYLLNKEYAMTNVSQYLVYLGN